MNKKYELLEDDCIEFRGKTLYRIRALKDFSDVYKGDIGGYIESEKNFSQDGNCWVYDNAKVYDNTEVYGHSKVYGYAEVHGNANVYGNARVWGCAEVCGNASIYGYATVYGNVEIYGYARVYDYASIYNNARVYHNAEVYEDAEVYGRSKVCGNARVYGDAEVYENAVINKGTITGKVSIPFKDIFQYQCRNRLLTAILTEDNEILYSIGCQENITEEKFIDRIHNTDGGLENNSHRKEYLKLIPLINQYFKGE